jgi:predicted nucleotidyltransferase component of viral defense system
VKQELIISRALVELFSDPFLRGELRFRGGTALNKLHFTRPQRYSEDIDLVRTTGGPIGPVLDQIRKILVPWLGRPRFDQSDVAPKFRFRVQPEGEGAPIRIKIEINTRARSLRSACRKGFRVENPWFAGEAGIPTFSIEEMLATKLHALLQRNKGRDLIDLSHSREVFPDLSAVRVVELLGRYLALSEQAISRAQAEERMFGKLERADFLSDVRPLLTADAADRLDDAAARATFISVFAGFIRLLPGDPWANSSSLPFRSPHLWLSVAHGEEDVGVEFPRVAAWLGRVPPDAGDHAARREVALHVVADQLDALLLAQLMGKGADQSSRRARCFSAWSRRYPCSGWVARWARLLPRLAADIRSWTKSLLMSASWSLTTERSVQRARRYSRVRDWKWCIPSSTIAGALSQIQQPCGGPGSRRLQGTGALDRACTAVLARLREMRLSARAGEQLQEIEWNEFAPRADLIFSPFSREQAVP